jgi:hypothetical protein
MENLMKTVTDRPAADSAATRDAQAATAIAIASVQREAAQRGYDATPIVERLRSMHRQDGPVLHVVRDTAGGAR